MKRYLMTIISNAMDLLVLNKFLDKDMKITIFRSIEDEVYKK